MARQVPAKNGGTLTRPDKGETMNPNGRPRKLVSHVVKELADRGITNVKSVDVVDTYEKLLNLSQDEITALGNDKDTPVFVRFVIQAMARKGAGFEIMERMIDRAHGRPKNTTDVKIEANPFLDLIKKASGDSTDNG